MAALVSCTPSRTSTLFMAWLLVDGMLGLRSSLVTCLSTNDASAIATVLTEELPTKQNSAGARKLLQHVLKVPTSDEFERRFLRRQRSTLNHLSMKRLHNSGQDDVESLSCNWQQDLEITQDASGYLPDGMPIYHVTVTNTCTTCFFSNIHIACGEFASATVVDPAVFRRVADNDCILKNGGQMDPMATIFFEYVSLFPFTMDVAGAVSSCQ